MKRLIIPLIASLFLVSCSSTDPAIDAAFSKYSGHSGIVAITVPGFVIKTATAFADIEPEERRLLQHIDKVKIIAQDEHHGQYHVDFYKEFGHLIDEESYVELMSVKESDNNIRILAQAVNDEEIHNLLVVVGGDDNALVFVEGDFTLDQLADVVNKHRDYRDFSSMIDF